MVTTVNNMDLKTAYLDVTSLYDCADELIASTEQSQLLQQEAHYQLVNPVVEQLELSADLLANEFITAVEAAEQHQKPTNGSKIESALRMVYTAFEQYGQQAQAYQKQAFEQVTDIVDPVMEKIKRQVEKVITIFIGFVDLALDRIMPQHDLEALKQRDAKIASMLHHMAVQPGKAT